MLTIKSVALFILLVSTATADRLGGPRDETRRLGASTVDLGTAGDYTILSKTGVTTTDGTSVTGDVGTSPITSTAITGFGLIMDSSNKFSTSSLVVGGGKVYGPDYTAPTPSNLITAISDMETAFTDAAGRSSDNINEHDGDLTGKTLGPGVYKWSTPVHFSGAVTFNGSSTDIWILQIAKNVVVASAAQVTLAGGALAKNIFWQVSGDAAFGTESHLEGVFLVKTAIVFKTGSSLNGAALAQTAVTLDAATIVN